MALTNKEALSAMESLSAHFTKAGSPLQDKSIVTFSLIDPTHISVFALNALPPTCIEQFKAHAAAVIGHPLEGSDFVPAYAVRYSDKLHAVPGNLSATMINDQLVVPAALKPLMPDSPAITPLTFLTTFEVFGAGIATSLGWPDPQRTKDEATQKLCTILRGYVPDAVLDLIGQPSQQFAMGVTGGGKPPTL